MNTNVVMNGLMTVGALAMLSSIATTGAMAGNGGSYNGPDLSGSSIPVAVDREVTKGELKAATRACDRELVKDLANQIGQGAFVYGPNSFGKFEFKVVEGTSGLRDGWFFRDEEDAIFFAVVDKRFQNWVEMRPFKLPNFAFEEAGADSAYDELGEYSSDRLIAKQLRIALPDQMGIAVPMVNKKTGARSSITINMEKFVTCLLSQIQK